MPTPGERYAEGKMMGLRMLEERRRKQLQQAQLRQLMERTAGSYMPMPIGKLAEMGMPLDQFMPKATITPGGATVPMHMGAFDRLMRLLPKKETPATQATAEKNRLWKKYQQGEPLTKEQQQRIGVWKEPTEEKPSKGLTEATKGLFEGREERRKELRKHETAFHEAFKKAKYHPDVSEILTLRDFWLEYREGVPKDLRLELGKKIGFYKESKKATRETMGGQTEKDIYNECRDAGGTMEECKVKAGIQ